jgi:predicted phosphodiesterase
LAVLSDVHGNLPALEAVLADLKPLGVDGIIAAGDYGGGPQPQETIDRLRGLGAWMIRGNSEGYCLALAAGTAPAAWWTSRQFATTRWSCQRLDPETLALLATLPEQRVVALAGTAPIRVVHGSPRSVTEHLYPHRDPATLALFRQAGQLAPEAEPTPLAVPLAGVEEPVVVCGHSHIPWQVQEGGRLVLNPGAVGGPTSGDPRAQYALLTWREGRWVARLRAVAYDLGQIRSAYRTSGLLAAGGAFARACLLGIETGQNVPGRFVDLVHRLARDASLEVIDGPVPEEIWDRAVATFPWDRYSATPDSGGEGP